MINKYVWQILVFSILLTRSVFAQKNEIPMTNLKKQIIVPVGDALSCELTSKELQERKLFLKQNVFGNYREVKELDHYLVFNFLDEGGILDNILDMVKLEKQCCPFLNFYIEVLSDRKQVVLKLGGSSKAKDFLKAEILNEGD